MRGWGGEELRKSSDGNSGLRRGLGVMRNWHKRHYGKGKGKNKNKMSYVPLAKREILEEGGNLGLYQNPKESSLVFTQEKGGKYFFSIPFQTNLNWEVSSGGEWFGIPHAAEKEGDTIKLVFRKQFANIPGLHQDDNHFFIHNFELVDDKLIHTGPESPSNPPDHAGYNYFYPLKNKSDKKRLQQLNVDLFSDLEEWVIADEALKAEYGTTGINGSTVHESNYNKNGFLEEWAYHKYRELYPDQPMLEGFGVREEKKTNDGDSFNQDRIYAPNKFNKKSADKLTNFNPSTDSLEIDTVSFGIDSSATFASGKNKKELKKKLAKLDVDFLYDEKKGGLYFNENGSDKGFGEGGIIAILKGAPELTSGNLKFI